MTNGNAIGNAMAGLLVVGLIARTGKNVRKAFGKPLKGYGKKLKAKKGPFTSRLHKPRHRAGKVVPRSRHFSK